MSNQMTDLELVTKLAEEYGIEIEKKFIPFSGRRFAFYPTQLLAYTQKVEQAVLKSKQDALERKCIIAESQKVLPEGYMWAVTKGGHSICQPPRRTSPVIQEGMQLVPIEVTNKMVAAFLDAQDTAECVWKAMLNASKEG